MVGRTELDGVAPLPKAGFAVAPVGELVEEPSPLETVDEAVNSPDVAVLVVTDVRVSGQIVVETGTTEVAMETEKEEAEAGQSVIEDAQPQTVTSVVE